MTIKLAMMAAIYFVLLIAPRFVPQAKSGYVDPA